MVKRKQAIKEILIKLVIYYKADLPDNYLQNC